MTSLVLSLFLTLSDTHLLLSHSLSLSLSQEKCLQVANSNCPEKRTYLKVIIKGIRENR